ncbi:MAG: hypothetical protein ISR58_17585 [Anaerolineales bacterium]|nr:hypothetical protein [Chloroflexota bacterium]MBL6982989.1 hypothetical protein [Anaerolineales bacterium]
MRYLGLALKIVMLLGFWLVGCILPESQPVQVESAVVQIIVPGDQTHFSVGDLVQIKSRVTSTEGISVVRLMVNGIETRRDQLSQPLKSGIMTQGWQPTEPGTFALQTSIEGSGGGSVSSQVLMVIVDGESSPEQPSEPTTAVPEMEDTITLTITLTPTETLTPTLTPTQTLTWTPTLTYTPPTTEPLAAPDPIAPSGSYSCRSTIFLEWNPVYSANGIAYYEWVVEGSSTTEIGTTTDTQVEFFLPTCASSYRWQVRVVDNLGTIGPYSEWMDFSIE